MQQSVSDENLKKPQSRWTTLWYAMKFCVVGVANTLIDFGVFTLLTQCFSMIPEVAQVISYCCGLVNSYFFNTRWVFKKESTGDAKQGVGFIVVNLIALAGSVGALSLLVNAAGMQTLVAKVIATVFSFAINFFGNKIFVFKVKSR